MRSNTRRLFFLILLSTLFSLSLARDTITPTQPLADGETLISSGGSFALGFFTPTDSLNRYIGIWYNNIKSHTIVWVANRRHPITDSTGNLSITGGNGSLIIANHNSTIIWSWSTTSVLTNPVAQLLDNGNFVVKESNTTESFAWQSFDYPTDTLLPGMKLGLNLTSGLNRNITAWKSDDDPSPGEYCIAMDIRGDPQLAFWVGSVREWRSGPWNGLQFSGVPETRTFSGFAFEFVDSKEEIYYSYNMVNRSIITRLVVNQSGTTQRFVWLDGTNTWSLFWYTPKSQCDGYAICGPYGVCNPNESPICSCIQGFEPKSPQDWNLRDGSGGCVRKTALDCRNGTDGFITLSGALIPDTVSATVNMDMNVLDECRAMCLSNCSCTGYARAYVNGSGCIIWATELIDVEVFLDGGQDLYIRMAAADLGSTSGQSKKGKQVAVAIVVSVVLGTLLLACIGSCIWIRKKERRRGKSSFHEENDISTKGGELELPLFDLGTIAAATENFSEQNKLGEGGFGPVYKGKLGEGLDIAVKRLSKTSIQGIDEFKNEVMLIAKLQHRNLVRLLGCCIQGEEKMLIYEYMLNKSLDAYLFDKSKGVLLDWQTRYHIILGIARGLLYLHQDSRFRIIHRDLKASNILLDREMNPKISDFGMARIFGGDETKAKTRKVVGTYGYMSPEYAMDGIFSIKSDVFSFGVLILEIISGRKNKGVYLSEPHMYLLGHAWSLWKEGNSLEIIDTSLGSSFSMTEVLRCINVGLMCVQERPEDRPTMSSVVMMLGSDAESLPEPKQPGFAVRSGLSEVELPSSKQESCTINDVTLTMFAGR